MQQAQHHLREDEAARGLLSPILSCASLHEAGVNHRSKP